MSNKKVSSNTSGSGKGSIKKILGNFLDTNGAPDRTTKAGASQPTSGIDGYAAKTANVIDRASKELFSNNMIDRGSIISKASRSVMQFPLYVSQSIRIAESHTIGKAFERVYASFVQNVIAQNPVITDVSKINGLRFLRDYHTNIKESANVTLSELETIFNEYATPIDSFDEIMQEATINELAIPGGTMSFIACRPNSTINLESARLAHEPLEGFHCFKEAGGGPTRQTQTTKTTITNHDTTNTLSNQPTAVELNRDNIEKNVDVYLNDLDITRVTDAGATDRAADVDKIMEEIKDSGVIRTAKGNIYQYETIPAKKIIDRDGKAQIVEPESTKITFKARSMKTDVVDRKQTTTQTTSSKSDQMQSAVDVPIMLRDSDIKKFNGMQPFQFVVKFRVDPVYDTRVDSKGAKVDEVLRSGTNYEQSYILGVKTIMHPIKTKDLANDLQEIITGGRKGLQSVRYKTGEISWLKDYMLNLPSLKADAMKRLDDRRWLSTLKRLGEYEKLNKTLLKQPLSVINENESPIPNATLLLSRGDIERIKDETGIDLEVISTATALARRIFLIAIVIVDQTAGSFKVFFPDMDNDWDIQSIGALDAEVARIDNSPLMAEINRINRKG